MMKQDDNLKKFVQEHRESFDGEPLPTGLFDKFIRRTKKRGSTMIKRILVCTAAAACAATLVHSIFNRTSMPAEKTPAQMAATTVSPAPSDPKGNDPVQIAAATSRKPVKHRKNNKRSGNNLKPATSQKYDPLLTHLTGREPVSEKIDAILEVSANESLSDQVIEKLGQMFAHDESSNVRLAALNALGYRAQQPRVKHVLLTGLSREKDAVIQMELVRLLTNDHDTAVTEKLMELAQTPFTLPAVKDQINFALLTRME